jgi:hypothetical protein
MCCSSQHLIATPPAGNIAVADIELDANTRRQLNAIAWPEAA